MTPTGPAPVLIPGARERRMGHPGVEPAAPATATTLAPATSAPPAPLDAAPDARRLEYEREGGGSPRERQGQSQKTLTARLRRWLFGGN